MFYGWVKNQGGLWFYKILINNHITKDEIYLYIWDSADVILSIPHYFTFNKILILFLSIWLCGLEKKWRVSRNFTMTKISVVCQYYSEPQFQVLKVYRWPEAAYRRTPRGDETTGNSRWCGGSEAGDIRTSVPFAHSITPLRAFSDSSCPICTPILQSLLATPTSPFSRLRGESIDTRLTRSRPVFSLHERNRFLWMLCLASAWWWGSILFLFEHNNTNIKPAAE